MPLQKSVREYCCIVTLNTNTTHVPEVVNKLDKENIPDKIGTYNSVTKVSSTIYIYNNSQLTTDITLTYIVTLNGSDIVKNSLGSKTSWILRILHVQTPLIKSKLRSKIKTGFQAILKKKINHNNIKLLKVSVT